MESLGEILKRITKDGSRPKLTASELRELEGERTDKCPSCDGAGWVSYGDHFGEPNFGQAHPCPKCTGWYEGCDRDMMREIFSETFPHKKSPRNFQNFEQNTPHRAKVFADVSAWVTDSNRCHVLTLAGPNGTGKSHLLEAIARSFYEVAGWPVMYQRATRLMAEFRGELGKEHYSLEHKFQRLSMPELLIVDDVTEYGTKFQAEVLEDILEPRYMGKGYLAIGTNIPVEVMAEKWSYRLADRIFDIDSGDTEVIYTMGRSYRTSKLWPILGRRK